MVINFDYAAFLESTSALIFPNELRTEENLRCIGELATLFNISPDDMRILVSRSIDIQLMTFNKDKLRDLCMKQSSQNTEPDALDYSQSPITFLQAKQNGTAVVQYEKEILTHLMMDLKMPFEVINVMVEYILEISDNRLNKKFVEVVAASWIRNGIKTKDQAIQMAAKDKATRNASAKTKRKMHVEYSLQYVLKPQDGWKDYLFTDSLEKVNQARNQLHKKYQNIRTRILARQVSEYWIVSASN